MFKEEPKRLPPTTNVARELYLKSGNQCAFPGCNRRMIDESGVFIGQICHIEGALPGGERFNPNQTNEERRSFENLMLMCYDHHKITDDATEYPVERLKEMKRVHEQKFVDIALKLQKSIVDITTLSEISYSSCCRKLNEFFGWGHNDKELKESSQEINEWADKLKLLPINTRQIFKIMIERSSNSNFEPTVALHEMEEITGLCQRDMVRHYEMLNRYGFLSSPDVDEFGNPVCSINCLNSGWPFWTNLRDFTQASSISLEEVIVNLNFKLLD